MSDLSAFPITRKWPAEHPDRLQLYSLPTPNGVKVSIMLEELGLPYEPHLVSFERNDQMSPEFLSLNPNNKIPAILDPNGPDGQPLVLSFELIRQLLAPAFAIAMLGAIESLLCAVVADGMTGSKHDPNGELLGQGLGNLVAPLFGGITATAAIARSAANVRAGAVSPLSAIIHAGVVLLAMLLLAPVFSLLPMASLAALLLMVAWNMSEPHHVIHTLRIAPRSDVLVLLTCLVLTVLFDMVLAVGVGLLLACGLFIKRMSELTDAGPLPRPQLSQLGELPDSVLTYSIRGPLFFGAAEKALSVLRRFNPEVKVVIVEMSAVPMLDMTALAALENVLRDYHRQGVGLVLSGASANLRLKLRLDNARYDAFTVMIVLNVEDRVVGIVVDSVSDVIPLSAEQIRPTPEFGAAVDTRFISGIGTHDDRMLILLDIETLLDSADMGQANLAEDVAA